MKKYKRTVKFAFFAIAFTAMALFVLAGCMASGQQTGSGNTIDMNDNNFAPSTLTVKVNTTVTWHNAGMHTHTVTSNTGTPISSGDVVPGGDFKFTFTSAGTYPYYCIYHGTPGSGMIGSITVTP